LSHLDCGLWLWYITIVGKFVSNHFLEWVMLKLLIRIPTVTSNLDWKTINLKHVGLLPLMSYMFNEKHTYIS
jgi:hypothetical protein